MDKKVGYPGSSAFPPCPASARTIPFAAISFPTPPTCAYLFLGGALRQLQRANAIGERVFRG